MDDEVNFMDSRFADQRFGSDQLDFQKVMHRLAATCSSSARCSGGEQKDIRDHEMDHIIPGLSYFWLAYLLSQLPPDDCKHQFQLSRSPPSDWCEPSSRILVPGVNGSGSESADASELQLCDDQNARRFTEHQIKLRQCDRVAHIVIFRLLRYF
jgi:hypothetical protein